MRPKKSWWGAWWLRAVLLPIVLVGVSVGWREGYCRLCGKLRYATCLGTVGRFKGITLSSETIRTRVSGILEPLMEGKACPHKWVVIGGCPYALAIINLILTGPRSGHNPMIKFVMDSLSARDLEIIAQRDPELALAVGQAMLDSISHWKHTRPLMSQAMDLASVSHMPERWNELRRAFGLPPRTVAP